MRQADDASQRGRTYKVENVCRSKLEALPREGSEPASRTLSEAIMAGVGLRKRDALSSIAR